MTLSKYISKQFLLTFLFSEIAICLIFLIVNLMENLDAFLDNKVEYQIVVRYYLSFLPEIIRLITPISILLGILFSLGRLSTNNEIVAMKSSGYSLYQLMLPFFVICFILSIAQLYFNGWIVPKSMEKKFLIEKKYLNKITEASAIYNFYFRDTPMRNVSIQYYDPEEFQGNYIFIEDFANSSAPILERRIEAKRFIWDNRSQVWRLYNGIVRTFENHQFNQEKFDSMTVKLVIDHDNLLKLKRRIEEMNFDELKEYLVLLEKGGRDVRKQMIKYYGGYAFPFANLIVVFFAVPFASLKLKSGIALQIAGAMVFSFLYLFFTEIGQIIVYTTPLHPAFGGWLANIIYLIFGIIVIIKTPK